RIQGEVQTRPETEVGKPATLGEQRRSDGRALRVFGDGMFGRSCHVNRGDLANTRRAFIVPDKDTKNPLGRSQSAHSS
ncbi:MAG: hypothetical protein ABFD82_11590, partial [Syntrophaceae bacterium]